MAKLLIPLVEIPSIGLYYKFGRLQPSSTATINTANYTFNYKVGYVRNDVTVMHMDAIVNAAKNSLLGGSGIDGAIHKAAGPDLLKECRTLHGCETGSAKITDAYKLPCRKVIHAVGPDYTEHDPAEAQELLQACYRTCLELAVENGLQNIAFPCLSAGIYGYPAKAAAETALGEVRKFLESGKGDSLKKIVFCIFTDKDEEAYNKLIPKIFPPTEQDLPDEDGQPEQQAHDGALLAEMPVPPSFDPGHQGQPSAKKLKVAHVDTDDNWESIGKPDSDTRGDEEMATFTGADVRVEYGASNDIMTVSDGGGHSYYLAKD